MNREVEITMEYGILGCAHQIHIHPILIQLFNQFSPPVALIVHGGGNFQET